MEGRSAITVNTTAENAYAAWRDFERFPSFMAHVQSVTTTGDRRSHWVVSGPADSAIEWDAEITDDVPNQRIAWKSLEGASVENDGSVEFRPAPGGRGTELHVQLRYTPPGGPLGAVVAKLFGEEPNQQLADDLRRFKQILETGEIARSGGSPLGARTKDLPRQHAGQPLERANA